MKILYMSDLHTEINGHERIQTLDFAPADVLVLAGDIIGGSLCRPNRTDKEYILHKPSLDWLKYDLFPRYKRVIHILGNHEHYHNYFMNTATHIRTYFADVPNYKLYDNETVIIEGVRFLCSTLWSNFENGNPLSMVNARQSMNDYNLIYMKNEKLHRVQITPNFILDRYYENINFLNNELQEKVPTVVVTHHAPSFQCINNRHHLGSSINGCYATSLEEFILDRPHIMAWISGHTHNTKRFKVGNTWLLSNQCGYYIEPFSYYNFTPNHLLEIQNGSTNPYIQSV